MSLPRDAAWTRAAAALYGCGVRLARGAYDAGIRRSARLPVPVWSVGNLAVGGTGKTPVVRELVLALQRAGRHPAVLTRGYARLGPGGVLLGNRLDGRPARVTDVGDEPWLLSRWLPDVPIGVDASRTHAGTALLARGLADCFVLDDGFQHRALARDVDLVLVDGERPFGNGRLLPAGPLREPPAALSRATHLLLTGAAGDAAQTVLDRAAPGVPRMPVWAVPGAPRGLMAAPADWPPLAGLPVWGVAGIARPERFRALLEASGADVRGFSVYADHHPFTREEMAREEERAALAGARLLTTEKDAVRLEPLVASVASWGLLPIRMETPGGWDAFVGRLLSAGQ